MNFVSLGPHGGLELILDAQQYEYMYYYFQDNFGAGMWLSNIADIEN